MTPQSQIIAIAELDGWQCNLWSDKSTSEWYSKKDEIDKNIKDFTYLHSRDAIVPVIEKVIKTSGEWHEFTIHLFGEATIVDDAFTIVFKLLQKTPSQLCEALLRATGKWTEGDT